MRFLNLVANKIFSFLFTWLLGQRFTDTLCGTKVLYRSDYLRASKTHAVISATSIRSAIDRICGASRLSLKIIEAPIRYANRTYGETQNFSFSPRIAAARLRKPTALWEAVRNLDYPR